MAPAPVGLESEVVTATTEHPEAVSSFSSAAHWIGSALSAVLCLKIHIPTPARMQVYHRLVAEQLSSGRPCRKTHALWRCCGPTTQTAVGGNSQLIPQCILLIPFSFCFTVLLRWTLSCSTPPRPDRQIQQPQWQPHSSDHRSCRRCSPLSSSSPPPRDWRSPPPTKMRRRATTPAEAGPRATPRATSRPMASRRTRRVAAKDTHACPTTCARRRARRACRPAQPSTFADRAPTRTGTRPTARSFAAIRTIHTMTTWPAGTASACAAAAPTCFTASTAPTSTAVRGSMLSSMMKHQLL
jgi:hypothetical protein